jgi:hypothetical protein
MTRKYTISNKKIGRPRLAKKSVVLSIPFEILEQVLVLRDKIYSERVRKIAYSKN